jgi:hypothetical protein
MIDAFMTPSGFAALIRERNLKPGGQVLSRQPSELGEKPKLKVENVEYAFFAGPTSFLIVLGDSEKRDGGDTPLDVMMQFQDFGWKVTRVFLPVKKMLADQKAGEAFEKGLVDRIAGEADKKPSLFARPATQPDDPQTARKTANAEYIDKVKLYDFQARYIKANWVPGITFKLKNEGNKTLKRVEVTVYFRDASGNIITEETFNPVLVSSLGLNDNKPLRPGYIWEIERGKVLTAPAVPTEWVEGRAEAKITSVEIAD